MTPSSLLQHRCHDYRHLVSRWRTLAREAGLKMRAFGSLDGYPLHVLRSPSLRLHGGIYLSAGIHGDEPAATEALLAWAARRKARLAKMPLLIFPCLNPWGLVNNSRTDARGMDPNRAWETPEHPLASAVLPEIFGMRFRLALTLHEDYDAQGFYVYEPLRSLPGWGSALLAAGRKLCPVHTLNTIDRRKVTSPGLIVRKIRPAMFEKIGQPEAVHLHLHHAERTFTFETPSEFSLDVRVNTQIALIEAALELLDAQPPRVAAQL